MDDRIVKPPFAIAAASTTSSNYRPFTRYCNLLFSLSYCFITLIITIELFIKYDMKYFSSVVET